MTGPYRRTGNSIRGAATSPSAGIRLNEELGLSQLHIRALTRSAPATVVATALTSDVDCILRGRGLRRIDQTGKFHFPNSRANRPPPLLEVTVSFEHVHRWFFGTPASACSMWLPHPLQVAFPHFLHVALWHISLAFLI